MHAALTRYRVMAWVTGVVLATMTLIGLPMKYVFHVTDEGPLHLFYSFGWIGHGWLYALYVITAVDLAFRCRWGVGRTLLVVLAGTVPFMSFVAEHVVTKQVRTVLPPAASAGGVAPAAAAATGDAAGTADRS